MNQESRIDNRVEESGVGNAGGIEITTTNLSLKEGGLITVNTFGEGNAGVIVINALGTISADGEGESTQISSGIYNQIVGIGDAGGIQITTTNLFLTRGGVLGASTFEQGDAGAIRVLHPVPTKCESGRLVRWIWLNLQFLEQGRQGKTAIAKVSHRSSVQGKMGKIGKKL